MDYDYIEQSETQQPFLIRLVIKLSGGSIKTEKEASIALLVVSVLLIGISFYLIFADQSQVDTEKTWTPQVGEEI